MSRLLEKYEASPCPFCGGENIYLDKYVHHPGADRYRVICCDCMAKVDSGTWQHEARAIEAWNTRAVNGAWMADEYTLQDGKIIAARFGDTWLVKADDDHVA